MDMATMADEPTRPSTWQLLFGANKKHAPRENNQEDDGTRDGPEDDSSPRKDVSAQLLKALQSRVETADDAIGRQCSDQLLGKKNALAPQLRLHDDTVAAPVDFSREDKERARKLIHTRLRVDQQANAIRQGKKTREQQRHDDMRQRPTAQTADDRVNERLERLREIQKQRDEVEQARQAQHDAKQKQLAVAIAKETKSTKRVIATTTIRPVAASAKPARPRDRPTQAPAAPNNQDDAPADRSRPAATKATVPPNKTQAVASGRALRVLEEKLRQLRTENQHVAELEDRMRTQQHVLSIKRRVWTIWYERVERRRRTEASVVRGFEWRLLQRRWAQWRAFARAAKTHRVEQEARRELVREKQQLEMADDFYRTRHLVRWFQRWCAVANATREARALDAEMQKRREHAARLMARVAQTQQESPTAVESSHDQKPVVPSPQQRSEKPQTKPSARKTPTPNLKPRAKEAWSANDKGETKASPQEKPTTKSAPSPDAFYVSMLERAEQRKLQREQLKLKYEQLEQAKREALAVQVAEREALFEQQKQAERDRVRERKREQLRIEREKAAQREVAAIKQQSAALHDRLRLLFHYAWRPWQQAWRTRKRVTRNVVAWHDLRMCHRAWQAWRRVVRINRAQQRLREQARLAAAAHHHDRTLLQRVVAQWKLAVRATQQTQLTVRRQMLRNEARRAWQRWRHAYALVVGVAQQRENHARVSLERRRQRRMLVAWREAAADAKRERVRQTEKDLLWKKARMWLND